MPPAPTRSRMSRWRAASLLGVHLLIGLHFIHWKMAGRTLAPVEPSEMFDTLHLGIITVGFLFMLGLVIATSIAGRFFCSWGCHILALQDLCAWLLTKLHIRTRPIRSRMLLWVPPLAVVYLFVWPQLKRLYYGQAQPSLHVLSDPDQWTSFMTSDLLRSFPGLGMTLFTFAICGFAIVYFLGSRSFCRYACPYGAIFAGADRLSPLRIIAGSGECSQCGLCTANCKSSIHVIEEVRQFGTVMNSNCFKDLDCISVCPTDALKYGLTKPPLLRSWLKPRGLKKQYDFTLGEDLLIAAIFVATLPVIRGLYDAISFLLALALTGLLAYFAIVSLRLIRNHRVSLANFQLKSDGRLTFGGRAFAMLACTLGMFVLHSAFIRYHALAGQRAFAEVRSLQESDQQGSEFVNISIPATEPTSAAADARSQATSRAIYHLEQASHWGLVRPVGLRRQLATLYQQSGATSKARSQLHSLLERDPGDQASRLHLGRLWLQDGRLELAREQFRWIVDSIHTTADPASMSAQKRLVLGSALFNLGDIEARSGNRAAAMRHFESAVAANPKDAEAHLALGAMLAAAGRLDEAEASFKASAELRPESAAAHNNLGAVLVRLHREQEALQHYRRSLELMPNNPLAYYNVGLLLANLGELDEAEEKLQQALAIQPSYAAAHAALALVWERRGQSEQAARHRQQSAPLETRPQSEGHGVP